jgi:hypothetical protein
MQKAVAKSTRLDTNDLRLPESPTAKHIYMRPHAQGALGKRHNGAHVRGPNRSDSAGVRQYVKKIAMQMPDRLHYR